MRPAIRAHELLLAAGERPFGKLLGSDSIYEDNAETGMTVATGFNVVPGDLVWVQYISGGSSPDAAFSDNLGNTYDVNIIPSDLGSANVSWSWSRVSVGGLCRPTVTHSSIGTLGLLVACAYTGPFLDPSHDDIPFPFDFGVAIQDPYPTMVLAENVELCLGSILDNAGSGQVPWTFSADAPYTLDKQASRASGVHAYASAVSSLISTTSAQKQVGFAKASGGSGLDGTVLSMTFRKSPMPAKVFGDLIGRDCIFTAEGTGPYSLSRGVPVEIGDLIYVVATADDGSGSGTVTFADNLGNSFTTLRASRNTNCNLFVGYSIVSNAGISKPSGTWSRSNSYVFGAFAYKGSFNGLDINTTPLTDNTPPYNCPATGVLAQADELVLASGTGDFGNWPLSATAPNIIRADYWASQASKEGWESNNFQLIHGSYVVASTVSTTPQFWSLGGGQQYTRWHTATFRKST